VILVYQAGKVGRLVLKRAKVHLESARAQVWGVVLNDVQAEVADYASYTHYYTHYYGEEGGPDGGKGWWRRVAAAVGEVVAPAEAQDEARPTPAVDEERRRRVWEPAPRYRHLAAGIVLLLVLTALLAGVLSWRLGWLRAAPAPVQEMGAPAVAAPPSAGPRSPAPPAGERASRGMVLLGLTGALGGISLWLARGLAPARYRHVWPAIVLLLVLVGLFAGVLSWRLEQARARAAVSDSAPPRS